MTAPAPAARRAALRLSWALVAGSIAASLGGLVPRAPYRDNALVTGGWLGNDLVTLLVAAPLLALACVGAARGSARWTLVWLGMLDYTLYNFAFYLFGAALNE